MQTRIIRNIGKKPTHTSTKINQSMQEKRQEENKMKGKATESNEQTCFSDVNENKNKLEKYFQNIPLKSKKIEKNYRENVFLGNKRGKRDKSSYTKKVNITENLKEEENRTIFVKSFNYKMTKSILFEIFKEYGDILMIEVKSPYISLVQFKDQISVDKVIRNKNKIFHKGKKLKVQYSKEQIRDKTISEFNKIMEEKEIENIKLSESDDNDEKSEEVNIVKDDDEDKFSYLEKKIKNLEGKYKEIDRKYKEIDRKYKEINGKYKENKKEIKNLKLSTNIMSEIIDQTKIHSKLNFNYMNNKLRLMLNSYKILYMRKLSNLLLEQIYNKYSENLGKGKINYGKKKKNIIVVLKPINTPQNIDNIQVNLLIEYLRFIWDKSSSVIHVNDKSFPYQKEIFHEYLKGSLNSPRKKIKDNNAISIRHLVNILFEKDDEKRINLSNDYSNNNKLVKIIEEMLKEKNSNSKDNNQSFFLNDKENEQFIFLSDSEDSKESIYDIDENEIKNYIENNSKEFDLSSQINKLIKLIELNKDRMKLLGNVNEINPSLFYNIWKSTFDNERYKLKPEFIKYFKKEKIQSLKEMGNLLCTLLEGVEINIFQQINTEFVRLLIMQKTKMYM